MFDDDFDLDAEEPESPCGVTAFDVERAARRKAVTSPHSSPTTDFTGHDGWRLPSLIKSPLPRVNRIE